MGEGARAAAAGAARRAGARAGGRRFLEGAVAILGGPARDGEREVGLVGGLHPPLEHAERRVGGERARRVLEPQHRRARPDGLVDVRVGLELEARVLAEAHRHRRLRHRRVGDEELEVALQLHPLEAAVAVHRHHQLLVEGQRDRRVRAAAAAAARRRGGAAAGGARGWGHRHDLALVRHRGEGPAPPPSPPFGLPSCIPPPFFIGFVSGGGARPGARRKARRARARARRGGGARGRAARQGARGARRGAARRGAARGRARRAGGGAARGRGRGAHRGRGARKIGASKRCHSHALAHAAAAHRVGLHHRRRAHPAHRAHPAALAVAAPPLRRDRLRAPLRLLRRLALLRLPDHVRELLLVRLHLHVHLDVAHRHVLAVAERDDLVEREDDLERVLAHVRLVDLARAVLVEHLREEPQHLEVLDDVRVLVRDEHEHERLDGLVHVPHLARLHRVVLLVGAHHLGERREVVLYSHARHLDELPGDQYLPALGHDGGAEAHHPAIERDVRGAVGRRAACTARGPREGGGEMATRATRPSAAVHAVAVPPASSAGATLTHDAVAACARRAGKRRLERAGAAVLGGGPRRAAHTAIRASGRGEGLPRVRAERLQLPRVLRERRALRGEGGRRAARGAQLPRG